MRVFILLLPAVLFVIGVSLLQADTIHVPADSATIQAGINGAVDGDTVLVADGTYTGDGNRNIDLTGKAIVVMSENGPDASIIDLENVSLSRGFVFQSSETYNSVIDGFTVTNGNYPSLGGGIYCTESSPTIRNCIISDNFAHSGGGINCGWNSSPVITNCIISGNSLFFGGGIVCGGFSSPTISNCIISDNLVMYFAGGVMCSNNSSPTIISCVISGNSASRGGGIYCLDNSSPSILNCTISDNSAEYGGGIYCEEYCSPIVTNTVLWGDSASVGPEISLHSIYTPSSLTVSFSDVEGGEGAAYVDSGCTLIWNEGNIGADPLFIDPDNDDYHLQFGSPCINAGDPEYIPEKDETDIDGDPRVMRGRIDIGADEIPYPHHGIPVQLR
jgi:predicted outer membrane repeat protein